MPIAYPISLPASGVKRISIGTRSAVIVTESPMTYSQQAQAHPGKAWSLSAVIRAYKRAEAEAWVAALVSLNGREGTFLAGDTANLAPRGVGTGVPLVKGAGQTGSDLITDGWTADTVGILKVGDWIQLGTGSSSRLHKVLADANSDGAGEATLVLWPFVRTAPADNAAIVVNSPKGCWRLTHAFEYDIDERKIYEGMSFSAIEAL